MRRRRPIWPPWTTAAAGGEGKRGRGHVGFDSPAHLRLGRRSGVGRRGPPAAAQLKRGGGAGTGGEWLEAAEVVAGMAGGSGSLL